MKNKNIILTGGHARSTAFAVIQEIKNRKKNWKIYFIGPKSAFEGKKISNLEKDFFPDIGVNYYQLRSGRLQTKFTIWTPLALLKIPIGFFHALTLLLRIKPDLILSFGGYTAFPVVVVGWLLRVPIIVHEQTSILGRANRYSLPFASQVAISRESSKKYIKNTDFVLTGNPVSKGVSKLKPKDKMSKPPEILVTGGQTGSVAINSVVENALETLLKRYKINHQVGKYQFKKFRKVYNKLPLKLRKRYSVYSVISPASWYKLIEKSDIVVSRSGANIVSELLVAKRPSILIPLPIAHNSEQLKNAEFAKTYGIATIITQDKLDDKNLVNEIEKTVKDWSSTVTKVRNKKSPDIDADKRLVDVLENYLN